MDEHKQELIFLALLGALMFAAIYWSFGISAGKDPTTDPNAPTPASDNTAMPKGQRDYIEPIQTPSVGHVPGITNTGGSPFWPAWAAPWRPLPIGVNVVPIVATAAASDPGGVKGSN